MLIKHLHIWPSEAIDFTQSFLIQHMEVRHSLLHYILLIILTPGAI